MNTRVHETEMVGNIFAYNYNVPINDHFRHNNQSTSTFRNGYVDKSS